ncbi:MAG: endolytic transglycosylase MltG [Candidatus Magasanikbacteria bacterium]|nr:endolytic transglycosylase MltG [Candidatus Magasanikbacteria bacterium]
MRKYFLLLSAFCILSFVWFLYSEIYTAEAQKIDRLTFEVKSGESVGQLAERLESERVIGSAWLFKKYLRWKNLDTKINIGEFELVAPITLARVADVLSRPGLNEREITIIPGWTIRDTAQYFESKGMFQAEELTELVGLPAVSYKNWKEGIPKLNVYPSASLRTGLEILKDKPWYVSYEGYLAPETYRIYKNAKLQDIVLKLIQQRESEITDEMWQEMEKQQKSFYDILIMASILEREVKSEQDKRLVADIFWRRYKKNWALQTDSTVHYAVNKSGEIFTTPEDRDSISPWNTYKYPGLPPSPISNPSLVSIKAALYPEKNDYWYFLTTSEGEVRYARTLEEHNKNKIYVSQ